MTGWILLRSMLTQFSPENTANHHKPTWAAFRDDYIQRYKRQPPETLRQWLNFANRNGCEAMRYYDAIDRDLAVFRNRRLHRSNVIPVASQYSSKYATFSLKNNVLTTNKWTGNQRNPLIEQFVTWVTMRTVRWLLAPLTHHSPPITTDFVLNLRDEPASPSDAEYPIFSYCHWQRGSTTNATNDLLFPYILSYSYIGHSNPQFFHWPWKSAGLPWRKRQPTVVWRGSTTGPGWGSGPRFQLVREYGHPNASWTTHITKDIAFARVVQNDGGETLNTSVYRKAGPMTYREMQRYQYVLDVDGNSFTERFPKLLASGTLVLKSTQYREWLSERVQPWVDYVPVQYNLSDLVTQVEWAHNHPHAAAAIVQHARSRVLRHLRVADARCYTYRLLLEYHALFDAP